MREIVAIEATEKAIKGFVFYNARQVIDCEEQIGVHLHISACVDDRDQNEAVSEEVITTLRKHGLNCQAEDDDDERPFVKLRRTSMPVPRAKAIDIWEKHLRELSASGRKNSENVAVSAGRVAAAGTLVESGQLGDRAKRKPSTDFRQDRDRSD